MKYCFFLLALLCSTSLSGQAQQDTTLYRIETLDGNEYIGMIMSQEADIIMLKTDQLGIIQIKKADVKNISPVVRKQMKGGVYWFENPQSTRYFWQANGYGLKPGEGYYQNVWILFNQVTVGVTENLQIGAGLMPTFLFGTGLVPVWITPKLSIPISKDQFNVGLGAFVGTVIGEFDAGYGVLYGSATVGSRDKNLSLGVGYGYLGDEISNAPVITLSGMLRTGQRGYLMMENYLAIGEDTQELILFIGGRRLIKRSGLDFGLLIPTGIEDQLVAVPWLSLSIPFGRR